jgi:hypothetical protein
MSTRVPSPIFKEEKPMKARATVLSADVSRTRYRRYVFLVTLRQQKMNSFGPRSNLGLLSHGDEIRRSTRELTQASGPTMRSLNVIRN